MQRTIERTIETDTLDRPLRAAPSHGKAAPVRMPPLDRDDHHPTDRMSLRGGLLVVLVASLLGWAGIWWLVKALLS